VTSYLQKTQGWWEASHWSVSHNKQDKFGENFQQGGTALVIMNELSHKTTRPGQLYGLRPMVLGLSKRKRKSFSKYHPCKSNGHLTTYIQDRARQYAQDNKF